MAAHINTARLIVNTTPAVIAQTVTPTRQPWNTPGVEDFSPMGGPLSSSTKAADCEECSNGEESDRAETIGSVSIFPGEGLSLENVCYPV